MTKRFILILVDQMRYDCLEYLKMQNIFTPFLNDLSFDCTTYTNAFTPSPSCVPARASLVTGNEPFKNKKVGYIDKTEWNYTTFMQLISDRGIKTINVGKTHFYPQNNPLGFDINILYDPQNLDADFLSDYNKFLLSKGKNMSVDKANIYNNNLNIYFPYDDGDNELHPTPWTTKEALNQLDKIGDKEDFFMQVSYHRPHPPFDPPTSFYNMYRDIHYDYFKLGDWEKRYEATIIPNNLEYGRLVKKYNDMMIKSYFALITHLDYNIGEIIQYLKKRGIYEDTHIIFTSDHGEMLGEHNMFRKFVPFNGSAKIPFLYKNPSSKEKKVHRITSLIDIFPTILDYFEIKHNKVDGKALNSSNYLEREFIFGEHCFGNNGWFYVINNEYKYIWDSVTGDEYVFDMKNDESELFNLYKKVDVHEHVNFLKNKLKDQYGNEFVENGEYIIGKRTNPLGEVLYKSITK